MGSIVTWQEWAYVTAITVIALFGLVHLLLGLMDERIDKYEGEDDEED